MKQLVHVSMRQRSIGLLLCVVCEERVGGLPQVPLGDLDNQLLTSIEAQICWIKEFHDVMLPEVIEAPDRDEDDTLAHDEGMRGSDRMSSGQNSPHRTRGSRAEQEADELLKECCDALSVSYYVDRRLAQSTSPSAHAGPRCRGGTSLTQSPDPPAAGATVGSSSR